MKTSELKKGLTVTYIPNHLKRIIPLSMASFYKGREKGIVTSWNERFVFVEYGTGTSKATDINDLEIGDQSFYCADEWNSVLDGAFGRCESVCNNCTQPKP